MKKFAVITSWFYRVRSHKRLISFKNWLLKKWMNKSAKITCKIIKNTYKDVLFKLHLNKYLWFGTNFFFSKNYGLDHQSGYLTICYNKDLLLNPDILTYHVYNNTKNLYKLLSVAALYKNWYFGISKAVDLKKALVDVVRPFVSNKFVSKLFKFNNFFSVLWRNRFSRRRSLWRRKRRFVRRRMNSKFFYTRFTKRFVKFLFYYRYFDWMVLNDVTKKYPFGTKSQISQFYLKIVSKQFAPNIYNREKKNSLQQLDLEYASNIINKISLTRKTIDNNVDYSNFLLNGQIQYINGKNNIAFIHKIAHKKLYKIFDKAEVLNAFKFRAWYLKKRPRRYKKRAKFFITNKLNKIQFDLLKESVYSYLSTMNIKNKSKLFKNLINFYPNKLIKFLNKKFKNVVKKPISLSLWRFFRNLQKPLLKFEYLISALFYKSWSFSLKKLNKLVRWNFIKNINIKFTNIYTCKKNDINKLKFFYKLKWK